MTVAGVMGLVGEDEIGEIDRELFRLARGNGRLRLVAGEGLDRLITGSGHQHLGFPDVKAYAVERCDRTRGWVGESRTLARRLRELPRIGEALTRGRIGWCMAVLLAKHAAAETEEELLALASTRSVRAMKEELRRNGMRQEEEPEERWATLSLTVTTEEALLLKGAELLVAFLDGRESKGGFIEALLAEGQASLIERAPGKVDVLGEDLEARYQAWLAQLALHDVRRGLAEDRAEQRVVAQREDEAGDAPEEELPEDRNELDQRIRQLCFQLASRDLWQGRLLDRFLAARGPERLGYASERQYAEERLGCSRSAMRARVTLARRTVGLEAVRDAVGNGRIGYEAARLIAGIADPDTEKAWVERASRRTYKQLREEVAAAEMTGRVLGVARGLLPPTEEEMKAYRSFEREVITGTFLRRALGLPPAARGFAVPGSCPADDTAAASAIQMFGCDGATPPAGIEASPAEPTGAIQMFGCGDLPAELRPLPGGPSGAIQMFGCGAAGQVTGVGSGPARAIGCERGGLDGAMVCAVEVCDPEAAAPRSGPCCALTGAPADGAERVEASGNCGDGSADPIQMFSGSAASAELVGNVEAAEETGGESAAMDAVDDELPGDPAARRLGRVTVRFRVPERLLVQWRALERAHEECGAPGTYIEFLCVTLFATWVHQTDQGPTKWRRIYQRDLCRCPSPVCFSREPTLHHIVFRSKGGGDEDDNVTGGPCAFCHLMGVHALGSIRVEPPATNMTWTFGRRPFMEVKGREKRLL